MPRRGRCVLPEAPCHITQRGVDRRETFSSDEDRLTYLRLLQENLADAQVSLLAWCLMTNHVHLVALPAREDSLSILFRRVHGRYAQYYNARWGRTGHLWQNRFFACALGPSHLWCALAYVERNPVRAGLAAAATEYRWSSAAAHLNGDDKDGLLDMQWWRRHGPADWSATLLAEEEHNAVSLRACTYAGRPFGSASFVAELGDRFGRKWTAGRPRLTPAPATAADDATSQLSLSLQDAPKK